MVGLVITGVYILGWLAFVRPTFRWFRDDPTSGSVDTVDLGFITFFSLVIPLFWPLIAVGLTFKFLVSGAERDPMVIARKMGGESKEQRANRLERERADRERYIAKLERELGIGQ